MKLLNRFLDTFFHLPTFITIALITVLILWQLCDAGLYLGRDFIRLDTNQGDVTLEWADGCCDLDW